MPKYYVQSGSVRGIVDCFDEECAAVWAVHRAMGRALELDHPPVDDVNQSKGLVGEGMFLLDDFVRISERGFDRSDACEVDSHMAFLQWHQLTKAIESLQDRMDDMWD